MRDQVPALGASWATTSRNASRTLLPGIERRASAASLLQAERFCRRRLGVRHGLAPMRLHRNAKLGLAGRYGLVPAIVGGCSIREAARRHGVAPATACTWWQRWQRTSEEHYSLADPGAVLGAERQGRSDAHRWYPGNP
jgi:hypothetical protein